MKPTRPRLILALLAAASLALAAAFAPPAAAADKRNTDFAQVLPAGDTDAVFVVDDFFKYDRFDDESAMAKLLANPAVKAWFSDFLPKEIGDLKTALELSAKDTARLFSGKGAVAFQLQKPELSIPAPISKYSPPEKRSVELTVLKYNELALVEFKGSPAEYEDLLSKLEVEIKRQVPSVDIKRERVEGTTLRTFEFNTTDDQGKAAVKTFYVALSQGTIIVSTGHGALLDTLQNLARGVATDPLSGESEYLAVKKEIGENDGFFFVNLRAARGRVREYLSSWIFSLREGNPMAKAMVDPTTVVDTLALENFTSLYGSLTTSEKRLEARYGVTWKDPAGVAGLIRFGQAPVSLPDYASGDYKGIDVTTADYPAIWEAADHLVQTALPAAYPMIGTLAGQFGLGDLFVTLRKGVLENLAGETVSLTGFGSENPAVDEVPGKAVVLQIKDPVAAQAAIDGLVEFSRQASLQAAGAVGPKEPSDEWFKVQDYLGVKLYKLPVPLPGAFIVMSGKPDKDGNVEPKPGNTDVVAPPHYLYYALAGNRLIISAGAEEFTKGIIANMQKPGRSVVAGRFKEELGDLPGTPCSLAYGDVATYLATAINAILSSPLFRVEGAARDELLKARAAARDLHYFWAGKSFSSPGGYFGRLVVSEDQPAPAPAN